MKTTIPYSFKTLIKTTAVSGLVLLTASNADRVSADEAVEHLEFKHESFSKYENVSMKAIADDFDPASGKMTLAVTDISLPGNSDLKVELRRVFETGLKTGNTTSEFGLENNIPIFEQNVTGWSLDLPYIRGFFLKEGPSGATIDTLSGFGYGRMCTGTTNSVEFSPGQSQTRVEPFQYWNGKLLHIPGVTTETFLRGTSQAHEQPPSPIPYYAKQVTKSNFYISDCPQMTDHTGANIPGHEAIEVTGPDGKIYTFGTFRDYIAETRYLNAHTYKWRRMMLITRVEDRFGNYVDYNYDAMRRLTSIVANDGRQIDITYETHTTDGWRLKTATANGRTWTYNYDNTGYLSSVDLPDSRSWLYSDFSFLFSPIVSTDVNRGRGYCDINAREPANLQTFTVTDPDNLVTTYTTDSYYRGRYNVKTRIEKPDTHYLNDGNGFIDDLITHHDGLSYTLAKFRALHCSYEKVLVKKEVTGPGIPSGYTWTYDYTENAGHYDSVGSYPFDPLFPENNLEQRERHMDLLEQINARGNTQSTTASDLPATVPDADKVFITTVNGPEGSQKYYIDRDNASWTQDKILAVDYLDGSTLLKRQEFSYEPSEFLARDQSVQSEISGFDPVDPARFEHRMNKTRDRTILYYPSGEDYYDADFSEYNVYGAATKIAESNTATGQQRFTKKTLRSDSDLWLINFPWSTSVADTDITSAYESHMALRYHRRTPGFGNGELENLWLVYEESRFGLWRKRYTDYYTADDFSVPSDDSAAGMVRQVEYNELLAYIDEGVFNPSTANDLRSVTFFNYKRGQPQQSVFYSRYGSENDDGTPDLSDIDMLNKVVDDNGWLTSYTDLRGLTTSFTYDAMGRLQSVDLPGTQNDSEPQWLDRAYVWTDSTGPLIQPKRAVKYCALNDEKTDCADPNPPYTSTTTFDALLRPESVHNTDGTSNRYQTFSHDAYNQVLTSSFWSDSSDPGVQLTNTYDALNRLSTSHETGGGTQVFTYLSGNRQTLKNARGFDTETTFEAYGVPAYNNVTQIKSTIAAGEIVTTTLNRSVHGVINSISQSDGSTTLTEHRGYDAQFRLCKTQRPGVGRQAFGYNNLGQMIWKAEGNLGGTETSCLTRPTSPSALLDYTDFTYDNFGELRNVTYHDHDSPSLEYTRDGNGNVRSVKSTVSLRDADGDVIEQSPGVPVLRKHTWHHYTYNKLNLLESERLRIFDDADTLEQDFSLDYQYDLLGHVSGLQYPDSDLVHFAPNGFGEPTKAERQARDGRSLLTYANSATYHPNGMLDGFAYGNSGITHKTTLNARQLPAGISDELATNKIVDMAYTYDNNANIASIIDGVDNRFSLSHLYYDGLDRLTKTVGGLGIGSSVMDYDGFGNITAYKSLNRDLSYHYDMTSNRLTSVDASNPDNAYLNFGYDSRGNVIANSKREFTYNRANQMTSSEDNTYAYDSFHRRVKQTDSRGTSYSMYSLDGTLVYRQTEHGGTNYIYLGSKLVAKDGFVPQVSDTEHYRPFGESIEGAKDDVGYTGHKFDRDLGLSYMQARYYDPVIGRFYSNDPVGFSGDVTTFNRYSYVGNNPYKYNDPSGQIRILISPKPTPNTKLTPVAQGVRAALQNKAKTGSNIPKTNNIEQATQQIGKNMRETVKNSKPEVKQPSLKEVPKSPKDTTRGLLHQLARHIMRGGSDTPGGGDGLGGGGLGGSVSGVSTSNSDSSDSEETDLDTKRFMARARILMAPPEPPPELREPKGI